MNEPDVTRQDVKIRQGNKSQMNARVLGTSLAIMTLIAIGLYLGFAASNVTETATVPASQQTQTPTAQQGPAPQ